MQKFRFDILAVDGGTLNTGKAFPGPEFPIDTNAIRDALAVKDHIS